MGDIYRDSEYRFSLIYLAAELLDNIFYFFSHVIVCCQLQRLLELGKSLIILSL
jgi:hypothetical protein